MTEAATADPMEAVLGGVTELLGTARQMLESSQARDAELVETLRSLRPNSPSDDGDGAGEEDDQTRRERGEARGGIDPADRMRDPYTSGWIQEHYRHLPAAQQAREVRANFELATMLAAGAGRIRKPIDIRMGDHFQAAARFHMFEDRQREPLRVLNNVNDDDKHARAMDTAESGFGAELIGAQYVSELWQAARNLDTLVNDIRTIPMSAPTGYVPIDGNVPEMLFVPESTSSSATAYATSGTPSNRVQLTAKKFTIQQKWSGEMEEDSIIAYVPFLREMLAMSAAVHLGSAYLNGDTTNAGTGNINLDDADPADTKHYLAWDGIRHYWLVDATGQGVNQAGSLDFANLNVIRGRLNGGDDDVDNAVTNINWGLNPRDLRLIADWDTYMAMLDGDVVKSVDKYGPQATVLTGELGSVNGIPLITPPYASKTEADGKASTTEASNTKGQISLFAPRGYLGGVRRNTQLFMDRVQGTDQILIELYTRRAFTRFGGNVSAGIYNITV